MREARDSETEATAPTRRQRSKQERRRIVEETLEAGASVAVIARAHQVNANQVFHWRKLYHAGRLETKPATPQLIPVRVTGTVNEGPESVSPASGTIHVELGRARIRVEGQADPTVLRMILEQLGR